MKRNSLILLLAVLSVGMLFAQDFDRQINAESDITGTARYVAMGGAFTAIGGDVSAVVDNPAALGVFRRGELSISFDVASENVISGDNFKKDSRIYIPQASWVLNFNYGDQKQKGILNSSMMLQYHRLKNFNRVGLYSNVSNISLTDLMVDLTNGLTESQLQDPYWGESNEVGALSKIGYELYLINPDAVDPYKWHSVLTENEQVQSEMYVKESGRVDEYSFAWGSNINNKVYLGLGVNLQSVTYDRITTYSELFSGGGGFAASSSVSASGFGVNGSLGIIVHPVKQLRFGFSYVTPTYMSMTTSDYSSDTCNVGTPAKFKIENDKFTDAKYVLPMKMTMGVALQLNQMGMVSFEYDWIHQPKSLFPDMHQIKLGGELVVRNHFFFRAGYACRSSFMRDDILFSPRYNDLRADTDFKNLKHQHFLSAGFGYRNKYLIVEMAYQCRLEKSNVYAFSRPLYDGVHEEPVGYQNQMYDMNSTTHRLVLSLGWTLRR